MHLNYSKISWSMLIVFLGIARFSHAQFVSPLEIPPLLDSAVYNLTMDREIHNFDSMAAPGPQSLNRRANTFAFNSANSPRNSYLGPTLIWRIGRPQTLAITNTLKDPKPWSLNQYDPPTTVHLHGAHVPAWVDGGPHGVIDPGTTRTVQFDPLDSACTLWYHPHGQDETYTQVEMGLAGMIIVKDPNDGTDVLLPHTYGVDDIPLIIQDHVFDTVVVNTVWSYKLRDNLVPGTAVIDTNRTQKQRTVVINGVRFPYYDVPPQNVRLRILDGSSRLSFKLGLGQVANQPLPFKMVGSDGGYLSDSARTVTAFVTGPGIRNELVFDFSPYAGQTVYLLNLNSSMPGAIINSNAEGDSAPFWMAFNVGNTPVQPLGIVPPLPHLTPYDAQNPDTTRLKRLLGNGAPNATGFSIDNNQYEYDIVNDVARLNDIEVWTIDNSSNIAHPFHIHDIQFYVTDVVDSFGNSVTPLPIEYQGRKDDILVEKGWQVSFVTRFEDFGRPKPFVPSALDSAAYMYHCHILTHEDGYYANNGATPAGRDHHGMMQQFVVWDGTIASTEAQNIGDGLQLYPNPAHDLLHLRGESPRASEVRIYDLQGRELLHKSFGPFMGEVTIPVDGIAAGMVLVEWSTTGGNFTKKVVLR